MYTALLHLQFRVIHEIFRARLKVQLRFVEKDKLVLRNLKRRNQMVSLPWNTADRIATEEKP